MEAQQELEVWANYFEVTCCSMSALALAEVSPIERDLQLLHIIFAQVGAIGSYQLLVFVAS